MAFFQSPEREEITKQWTCLNNMANVVLSSPYTQEYLDSHPLPNGLKFDVDLYQRVRAGSDPAWYWDMHYMLELETNMMDISTFVTLMAQERLLP